MVTPSGDTLGIEFFVCVHDIVSGYAQLLSTVPYQRFVTGLVLVLAKGIQSVALKLRFQHRFYYFIQKEMEAYSGSLDS